MVSAPLPEPLCKAGKDGRGDAALVRHGPEGSPGNQAALEREIIADYGPDARVIVPGATGPTSVLISELLPLRYRKDGLAL